eukprot:6382488-Heterocapsa_arctica.AAC.1
MLWQLAAVAQCDMRRQIRSRVCSVSVGRHALTVLRSLDRECQKTEEGCWRTMRVYRYGILRLTNSN